MENKLKKQGTPFHHLSKEEQQGIVDANQKKVRDAPMLHEWTILAPAPYAWLMISIVFFTMVIIGGGIGLIYREGDWSFVYSIIGVFAVITPFIRYLIMADKRYHYRLTTEGLIATYQDAIPDVAYTIVRGLAWFGVIVCIIAMTILGPLALAGAGGMALLAIFFTKFKNEIHEEYTLFNKDMQHELIISNKHNLLRFESIPFKSAYSSTVYINHDEINNLTGLLSAQISFSNIRYMKKHPGI